jgi:hypothetical protein
MSSHIFIPPRINISLSDFVRVAEPREKKMWQILQSTPSINFHPDIKLENNASTINRLLLRSRRRSHKEPPHFTLDRSNIKNLNIFEFCPKQAKEQKSEQEPHQHDAAPHHC